MQLPTKPKKNRRKGGFLVLVEVARIEYRLQAFV